MIDNSKRYKFGPIGLIFFKFKTSTFAGSDLVSFFSPKIILHRVTNEREERYSFVENCKDSSISKNI